MPADELVPARLLDDVRVSMEMLRQQHAAAWSEVDRLHAQLRRVLEREEAMYEALVGQLGSHKLAEIAFQRRLAARAEAGPE